MQTTLDKFLRCGRNVSSKRGREEIKITEWSLDDEYSKYNTTTLPHLTPVISKIPYSRLEPQKWFQLSKPTPLPEGVINNRSDIQFDSQDKLCVLSNEKVLRLYDVPDCIENDNEEEDPILSLELKDILAFHEVGHVGSSFTNSSFVGESLSLACSYRGVSFVDIFDLETVEEDTCEPLKTFDLAKLNDSLNHDPLTANQINFVNSNMGVAALGDGRTAYLDCRKKQPFICTSRVQNSFSIGEAKQQQMGRIPLVAILASGYSLITGSKNGCVRAWDLRKTATPVSTVLSKSKSPIGSIISSNQFWCSSIIVSDFTGDVNGYTTEGLDKLYSYSSEDGRRQSSTTHLSPRVSLYKREGALFLPHISTNNLLALFQPKKRTEDLPQLQQNTCCSFDKQVCDIAFNNTLELLFVGYTDGSLHVYLPR